MDSKESPAARKVKFTPKAPPRRRLVKPILPKSELGDGVEEQELLRRVNAHLGRKGPKVEKTSSVQDSIEHGATPSDLIRTYGGSSSGPKDSISEYKNEASAFESDRTIALHADTCAKLTKKEYKEPWFRMLATGVLDDAEFGKDSKKEEYDETTINPALELGLLEESENTEMFFVQLPTTFPIGRPRASTKGKEIARSSGKARCSKKGTGELPGGFMGKMLVYKSGAIKLKLGDILHDVSPGVECTFAQDAAVINAEEQEFLVLGELGKKMIVTPDIDAIMDSFIDLR